MHYRKIVLVFIAFAGCVLANDPDPEAVAEDVHPEEEDEEVVIDPDKSPDCAYWADEGECTSNPGYMHTNCATSCARAAEEEAAEAAQLEEELSSIESFFDLSEEDIFGTPIDFAQFKGQVTIVVNVASYCGYTDTHYKQLVELWAHVRDTGRVNILAFPCNQFGQQEPEPNESILKFAQGYGVDFQMMSKIDVNGPDASIVYKFLKYHYGPSHIRWNFNTYFVIGPDGTVQSFSDLEPHQLKGAIVELLGGDEL